MATSNYAKFQTANPVVRRLIAGFYAEVAGIVEPLRPRATLDAGCGEGETFLRLEGLLGQRIAGIDVSPAALELARQRVAGVELREGSLYALPYADGEFDLVLCLEVLEHLAEPQRGLAELARVASGDLVLSVPREPWFRLGSLLRGKHLRALGNHPEHVNHWRPATFRELLAARLDVVRVSSPFPWLVAHCRPRHGHLR